MFHGTEYIYSDDICQLLWNSSDCYLIHSMLLQQQWSKQRRFLSLLPLLYKLNDLDKGIESPIKFVDNTQLHRDINLLEGGKILQRGLNRLNQWRQSSCRRLNMAKWQVLHSGHNNPIQCHRCEEKWLESWSAEKDLEVDQQQLNMNQQCAQLAKRVKDILAYIRNRGQQDVGNCLLVLGTDEAAPQILCSVLDP